MAELLASYSRSGERHRIELVPIPGEGALVLDRPGEGAPLVVAELFPGEGRAQALAVLHEGGYLERARRGEPGLGRRLSARRGGRQSARAA